MFLVPCSNVYAKCLLKDDPVNPCRYPSGDEWCNKYGGGNIYAYNDKCLKGYTADKHEKISAPPPATESVNKNIRENTATLIAPAPEDTIEDVLAQSVRTANENNLSNNQQAKYNEGVKSPEGPVKGTNAGVKLLEGPKETNAGVKLSEGPKKTGKDDRFATAIIIIIAGIILIIYFGHWAVVFSLLGLIAWLVIMHGDMLLSIAIYSAVIALTLYTIRKITIHLGIKRENKVVDEAIEKYIQLLATKRGQLSFRDYYGDIDTRQWEKEKEKFIGEKLPPSLTLLKDGAQYSKLKDKIDKKIDQFTGSESFLKYVNPKPRVIFNNLTPREYELRCAEELENYGWLAHVTPATRDQGADVIARMNDHKVVLQCKYLASTVPNKAVQEVYAARDYNNANFGAVVSNAQYSDSARQLASKLKIGLLHHDDLKRLHEIILEHN